MSKSKITSLGCMKMAFLTGFLSVFLFVLPALGQTLGVDNESAEMLGKAVEKNQSLAYVLGFVTISSMGLAAWTIKTKDEVSKDIQDLTQAIKDQNNDYVRNSIANDRELKDALKKMSDAVETMSKHPCALDSKILEEVIKGKFKS